MGYNYNTRLNPPDKSIDVNMEKTAVVKMMQALCRSKQSDFTHSIMPFDKVRYSQFSIPRNGQYLENFHGRDMTVHVIEPNLIQAENDHDTRPAMIYFHGGAFALPVQEPAIKLAAFYAMKTGRKVYMPEYLLLPDATGLEIFMDCLYAWKQLTSEDFMREHNIDADNIVLYGESAGGALATGITMYIQDHSDESTVMPVRNILIYPVLDNEKYYKSKTSYADAAWSEGSNESMWNAYMSGVDESWNKYLIPASELEELETFPETYIEPQEMDILHDEAIYFGETLQEKGISCHIVEIPGSYHSFDYDIDNEYVRAIVEKRIEYIQ
ncbi:MAG: alpha/beta hydrolase fold domain-containing protein [Lachnospiraceae bacterium]|nr:alpha/beta hydrolase fold domain-containing protein [Lachnospiraceae bacterium]